MKKLLMILLTAGMVSGASAQFHGGGHYGGGFYGGRTVIVGGYAPYYAYPGFYLGLGYPLYGYPYGYYPYGHAPSKLQMQVNDIKADYSDRIASVKADNTLSGKEKRQQIRDLKHERDDAVNNAVRNYWKIPPPRPNNNGSN